MVSRNIARLPASPPLCYAFYVKGYDGDEYASRGGTASPARWKRTPGRTRKITPEPPAERHISQVSYAGLADRYNGRGVIAPH